ncbi:MAG: hypothetical protein E6H64_14565 [Betaproteobacteria bacterium]|nr:MAG: hypothetical protein E6H64_14565 [Betaproteobacteria bacterium]
MVGEASRLSVAMACCVLALAAGQALAQPYVVVGQCRYGVPNGGYELRMPDGRLRVVGAFAQGRMTGTFIFWSGAGARVAVMPFDRGIRMARHGQSIATSTGCFPTPARGPTPGQHLPAPKRSSWRRATRQTMKRSTPRCSR